MHPTEIAYDFVTTRKTLDAIDNREAFGINLDPSHFAHQFLDTAQFALEFADRIYHVHVKDSKKRLDGRRSILASHLNFGEEARGWDFVSPGHGDVDFEDFFRALNRIGYQGPLSIEWEDSGMDRDWGAPRRARVRAQDRLLAVGDRVRRGDAEGGLVSDSGGFLSQASAAGGEARPIGIGMLGYAFMGKAHANGYRTLSYMTWPPPLQPRLVSIAGRNEHAVAAAATRYGFERYVTDWRDLVADPEIELFDNSGPNNLHAEPTIAAAEAGKHVICEKPLGRTADESYEIWQRVAKTGVKHMTAFNYRFVPAVRLARADDRRRRARRDPPLPRPLPPGVGPDGRARRGASTARRRAPGALGDLGAHVIDLARYLVGELDVGRGVDAHVPAGTRGRRRVRGRRRLRERRGRHARGDPLRARPQERAQLGDQRLEGVARVRPRAAERAAVERGHERLPHDPRLRGRPSVLAVVVAARAHDRLGAHLRARAAPPTRRDRGRHGRRAARRDLRGRLPRRGGVRRDPPLCRFGEARVDQLPLKGLAAHTVGATLDATRGFVTRHRLITGEG